MSKKNIAVIFGGASSEYSVSLESASGVISHLNRDKYEPILIGITKEGDWYYFSGDTAKIADDTWREADCAPAVISPARSEHELIVFEADGIRRIHIDVVLPILHGMHGEDGTVQGLCELAGIPIAGCGTLASALCMDKERAHKLVASLGVRVPESILLTADYDFDEVSAKVDSGFGYPLFVKPVRSGSSYGIAKVNEPSELRPAIEDAFRYDDSVILEENIPGFEVGCAVMGNEDPFTGELDEIELADGFFDFTEKYNLITSKIHVPARISPEKTAELKETAIAIYKILGCRCFARVDMFFTPNGEIVFNEVNTIPGFTPHSRFPSMMKARGISFEAIVTSVIEMASEQ